MGAAGPQVPFLASHVPVRPVHSHWLNKEADRWCQHGEREVSEVGRPRSPDERRSGGESPAEATAGGEAPGR